MSGTARAESYPDRAEAHARRAVLIVLAGGAMLAGCDSRRPNARPFDWGRPSAAIVRLPMTITEPRGRARVQRLKAIRCLVDLQGAVGANLPMSMSAFLVSADGRRFFAAGFEPASQRGSVFTFRAKLRPPERPGTYQLQVDATYGRKVAAPPGGAPPADDAVIERMDGPVLEVQR